MKLGDVREVYYGSSGTLSALTRQLSFAGIAIIWIFRTSDELGKGMIADQLLGSLMLFVIALSLDILQYMYSSAAWGIFNRHKERLGTEEDDIFTAPPWINWPTNFAFWAKSIATISGYCVLFSFLVSKFS